MAGCNAYATILCEHFYSGDSDDRVRIKSSAYLYGSHVFIWYSDCMPVTFTALGNATSSIIVAVTRKFILLLPLIYIMPHMVSDKTMGVYLAEPVADFIAVTFTAILFYFQFRKAMNKIES